MKAYKITYNGKCKNQLYEIGKTYQIDGKLIMCKNGFHFCKNPDYLFWYYQYRKDITKIFEIEILGQCIDRIDKSVTDKLKVIREIPLSEYNDLFKNHKFDNNNNLIHSKYSNGYEEWYEYNNKGNVIHYKTLTGIEKWYEYGENDNLIHYKTSTGYESWYECDEKCKLVHYKNNVGDEKWYDK